MALSEGLDIKLNTAVRQIRYNSKGVELLTSNARNHANPVTYKGQICLSSLANIVVLFIYLKVRNVLYWQYKPIFTVLVVLVLNLNIRPSFKI